MDSAAVPSAGEPDQPYAFLFAGAGSQEPGMAAPLALHSSEADGMLERISALSGLPIRRLCVDADAGILPVMPGYPAVFATGLAAWAAVDGRLPAPAFVAGHSLGHFAALVASGSLDLPAATRIVMARSELMERQARERPGALLSVQGTDPDEVAEMCARCPADLGDLVIGCYNGARHLVLSGDARAVAWAGETLGQVSGRKLRAVRAGLAAHSPLMGGVQRELLPVIDAAEIRKPRVPVLLNSTGELTDDVDSLRTDLAAHVLTPVRWTGCWNAVASRKVRTLIDMGPGRVMARMARNEVAEDVATLRAQSLLRGGGR